MTGLGPAYIVHINEVALLDQVRVLRLQNEKLWYALNQALLQGLNHLVILGQGGREATGDELGLGLGKPAAHLRLPEHGELNGDSIDGIDRVVGPVDDGVVDVVDIILKSSARPQNPR